MIKNVTIKQGQTIFDVSLQLYGDASRVFDLCRLNPDVLPNVLTKNLAGLTIQYEVQNNEATNFYATNGTQITTRFPEITSGASVYSVAFSPPFLPPSSL